MNEQSVLYIINYFNQYPDQPPEVLVQNIISSGYNMTDLKEALRRMGISPIVIPGYKEPALPPTKPLFPKMPFIIAGVVGLLVIAGLSTWAFMNSQKQVKKTENAGTIQQGVIDQKPATPSSAINVPTKTQVSSSVPTQKPVLSTSPTPEGVSSAEDPLKIALAAFALNDYKVIVKQYQVSSSDEIGSPETLLPQENTIYSAIQYFKKGKIVRHEIKNYGTFQISIMLDQYDIYLYPDEKQFIKKDISAYKDQLTFRRETLSFFYGLNQVSTSKLISWEKTAPYVWVGTSNAGGPGQVKVALDPNTKLLKRFWSKSKTDGPLQWMVLEFEYENIENIDSLLKIPEGYSEKSTNVSVTP